MASAERGAAGRRRLAFVAAPMLLSLFLAAMDSTVVGTLLPTIRAQMHDVDLFPWLLSGFLLAAALVIPIAGTLADRLGDRAVMLASLAAFAAGSAAICLAPTMAWLVGARTLQGAGAGGITVMAYVMLGRAFAGDSRARMQGLLSTVWGLAAILGPSLGLAVQAQLGWRAVFAINVPVVAVAFVLVLGLGHRRPDGAPATSAVDARAFLLLTILLCSLLLLVMSPGLSLGDGVGRVLALVSAVSLGLHVAYVRPPGSRRRGLPPRAARCVLPLPMLVERRYVVAGLLTLLAAAALYGSVTLLPLYLNALDGPSALDSGTVVTLGALGWVVGSAVCGMLLGRLGFRAMSVIGGVLLTAGAGLLWAATAPSVATAAAAQVAFGLGTGFLTAATLIYIQTICASERLGAFTSSVNLIRNVGAAVGINTLASLQLSYARHAAASAADPREALLASFRHGFLIMAVASAACIAAALLMPGRRASALVPANRAGAGAHSLEGSTA